MYSCVLFFLFFVFKQKTAYEMRISDWSSDVCSSDLKGDLLLMRGGIPPVRGRKIEYFRSKRFTSRISDPPKVAPRPIAINAVSSAAKLAGEASSSEDRKSTRLNSSHSCAARMPSSA